jgi:tRNA 5-methylaminomethyl-2-thiouridine biosynthesis bifunctional protein
MNERVVPARVDWTGDQPRSRVFGDIYHAPDGAAEVERAFVAPQRLTERLRDCAGTFTIGELGFGTALNFAVIAQRMLECAAPTARLHFISVELQPFSQRDFAAIARRRNDLPIYAELARAYPPLLGSWHRRHLAGGRITLSLFFGDAAAGLSDIVGRQRRPVDAWLLDGFAPDRNPELWSDAVWRAIAGLSGDGTTLATFSAVGAVRRGLEAVGFAMRKIDQRPFKRHSLAGVLERRGLARPQQPTSVSVIGAGLAGAATAHQLALRGIDVRLIDRASAPPNRMSTTLSHVRLQPGAGAAARLRNLAFLYAAHWHAATHGLFEASGALQFASDTLPPSRLDAIGDSYAPTGDWVVRADPLTASAIAGIPVRTPALYFPTARALDLQRVCAALIGHSRIEAEYGFAVRSIATDGAAARVSSNAASLDCDAVVLCNGVLANEFEQARYLELVPVAGQIDRVDVRGAARIALIGEGFALPHATGYSIGATYEHRPWDVARATAFNVERFGRWQRALRGDAVVPRSTAVIRGTRAVSSDRLPIVGGLFDADGQRLPRLAVSTGHGSQGTVTAPLAAECIASELVGEFPPLTRDQYSIWSSLRFRERQARRSPRGARRGH